MKAKSIKGKSTEEIKAALEISMAEGFKPTLAFVFLSARDCMDGVCALICKENISIFGSTTGGEFIDGDPGSESIVVLLLEMNPDHFKLVLLEAEKSSDKKIGHLIAESGIDFFSNPGFIVGVAGRKLDGSIMIKEIQEKTATRTSVFGGVAGNIVDGSELYVFDNRNKTNNGVVALLIDRDKVEMTGFATSGWQPIATFHTITKSEKNIVYTIDGEPAMDIIGKFLGISFNENVDDNKIYSDDAQPIQLYRDNAPSVLREVIFFDNKNRAINFAGPVPQGSKFRFSLPPDFDIVEKIKSDCFSIKEQQQEADALIVFSCTSRLQSLGPLMKNEIEEIKNTWDCPIAGYFSFGEIGNYPGGETEFHNNTCCVVALKEK